MMYFSLLVLLAIGYSYSCVPRDFGYDGIVCVCNGTYCDLPEKLPALVNDEFVTYTSSSSGLRMKMTKLKVNHGFQQTPLQRISLKLNTLTKYQKVEGFGGAFTDAAGINIAFLSKQAQSKLIEAYYSTEGIGFTIGRVPIGGSDFSIRHYTYSDDPSDTDLSNFTLAYEDYLYKLPYIRHAHNLTGGALRVIAAAWTAPPWMKTNRNYTGIGSLEYKHYALWAQYHIKFLEAYRKNGVEVWGLSTGNEPLNGDIPLYPFNCMGWTPGNLQKWIVNNLGPALKSSPFNETLIITYDDQRFELPAWLKREFQDQRVFDYVSGIGVHWYWDKVAPLDFLDKAHDFLPSKFILSTEACITKKVNQPVVKLGSWQRGEAYAESIINDMNHWVAGWVDWNLALDASGGPNWANNVVDAAIIVNSTADEFYKQPMFYALGHFSKFVPVHSERIGLSKGSSQVTGAAFATTQDTTVIVLLNKGEEAGVSIQMGFSKELNFMMPTKSIVTVVSNNPAMTGNSQASHSATIWTILWPIVIKMMSFYPQV